LVDAYSIGIDAGDSTAKIRQCDTRFRFAVGYKRIRKETGYLSLRSGGRPGL
jgi:hypothetical protein